MALTYPVKTSFYKTLREAVEVYFVENKVSKKGNIELHIKTALLLLFFVLTYTSIMFFDTRVFILVLETLFLAAVTASIGFCVMHDASHNAYSEKDWINNLLVLTDELLGVSSDQWIVKHREIHHAFTNTDHDGDLEAGWFFRFHFLQKWRPIHKYQHYYAVFFYGLLYGVWIWKNDFQKYFSGNIHGKKVKLKPWGHVRFWSGKVFHFTTMILVPLYFLGWGKTLLFYGLYVFVTGVLLSVVFQLAHITQKTIFPAQEEGSTEITEDSWAALQVRTTCNFAMENIWARVLLGGLNFQIEHHLFPQISHVHYPKIQPIVFRICQEYEVEYNSFETMKASVVSHLLKLEELGAAA